MDYAQKAVQTVLEKNPFRMEMDPQQLADALESFWSQVSMTVKSSMKDAQLQGIYAVLFSQVRGESNRVTWQDEPVVYTRVANRDVRKDIAAVLLVLAAVLMLVMALLLNQQKNLLGTILCGLAVVFVIAGVCLQALKGAQASHKVEQRLRPNSITAALENTARALDANAENMLNLLNPVSNSSGLDALELVRELYRTPTAPDANVASAMQMYLRRNGVKEVQYSEETASLFDVMPANGTRTIQPALVQETASGRQLVSKGLACVKLGA